MALGVTGVPVGGIREVGVRLGNVPTGVGELVRSGVGVLLSGIPAAARAVCVAKDCNIFIGSVTGGFPVAVGVGSGAFDADRSHATRNKASTKPIARIAKNFLDMSILLV
jgi:hypothetical protein